MSATLKSLAGLARPDSAGSRRTRPHRLAVACLLAAGGLAPIGPGAVQLQGDEIAPAADSPSAPASTSAAPLVPPQALPYGGPAVTFPQGIQPAETPAPVLPPAPASSDTDAVPDIKASDGSPALADPSPAPQMIRPRRNIDRRSLEKDERYRKLEAQVRQLDELTRRNAAAAVPPAPFAPEPLGAAHQPSAPPAGAAAEAGELPDAAAAVPAPREPGEPSPGPEPPAPAVAPAPATSADEPERTQLQPLVSGQVDRLGLADSLFASGDVARALEVYDQLPLAEFPPAQQEWVHYQQATCYRRLGNLGEAERRYRQIITESPAGWITDLCRWWLVDLDDRRRLTANAEKLEQILQTLSQESAHEVAGKP